MPLVAEDIVKEYLPDQQWAHMRPKIQEQMINAYVASEDYFAGNDKVMFLNYLFFMSPPMVEYLAKIIEDPRAKKNPFRVIELRKIATEAIRNDVGDEPDQVKYWTEHVLVWILMAYVYRHMRTLYYASLTEPPLGESSAEFLSAVNDFIIPKHILHAELNWVYAKAVQKVQSELAWAQQQVDANQAKVVAKIGESKFRENQGKINTIVHGKRGGRRGTRRSHRRQGTRKRGRVN